jgi:hypothetical protein
MGKPPPQGFDPVIIDYYNQVAEEVRLEQGPFQLEEARTRELIQRFAPAPPGIVVDVGGAAGAYALWLAGAGYSVHLVDLVPRLVEEAHRRSAGATRPLVSCRVGDARALEIPSDSADLVQLLEATMSMVLTEDMRAVIQAAHLCFAGTVSPDGKPNVSPKRDHPSLGRPTPLLLGYRFARHSGEPASSAVAGAQCRGPAVPTRLSVLRSR